MKDGPSDAKEHNFRRGGARWKGGRSIVGTVRARLSGFSVWVLVRTRAFDIRAFRLILMSSKMTHIEAKSINIWLRCDPK